MSTNNLTRLYDRLTEAERFRAFLQAEAREDASEMSALLRTCPKEHYRQNAAGFVDRLECLEELILAAWSDMGRCMGQLTILEALALPFVVGRAADMAAMCLLDGIALGREQAGITEDPSCPACDDGTDPADTADVSHAAWCVRESEALEAVDERVRDGLAFLTRATETLQTQLLAELHGQWVALERICEDMGITPEDCFEVMLKPMVGKLAKWHSRCVTVPYDEAIAGRLYSAYQERWRRAAQSDRSAVQ